MAVIKIFLASSAELAEDRLAFENMVSRLNPQWRSRDVTFQVELWENFIDAMSKDGLQKEYNRSIQECDVFVMLFFTKVGPYTLEEFETAFAGVTAGKGPKVYTYFRNDSILTGDIDDQVRSLLDFKARLRALKHYPTHYRNTEDLQWQFSRQLEMLYGEGNAATEISDAVPQWRLGEMALVLGHRQLFGDATPVDHDRFAKALRRSSQVVRNALFGMAQSLRQSTWDVDKHRMERTIPVFEALVQTDPQWHLPIGNLGYALKDKYEPDYERALQHLTRAVELRGDRYHEGPFYQYSRALCLIALDGAYATRHASSPSSRGAILEALRAARRELDETWEQVMENPDAVDVKAWLEVNGSPRLR